jgi:hypothetical protein
MEGRPMLMTEMNQSNMKKSLDDLLWQLHTFVNKMVCTYIYKMIKLRFVERHDRQSTLQT